MESSINFNTIPLKLFQIDILIIHDFCMFKIISGQLFDICISKLSIIIISAVPIIRCMIYFTKKLITFNIFIHHITYLPQIVV